MEPIFILLIGLQVKHYAADYLLQTRWMIDGKQSLTALGGYAHAAVHAAGTALVLGFLDVSASTLFTIVSAEFIAHYALDFAKSRYGEGYSTRETPRRYWAVNGLDQLLHQLTYVAIIFVFVQTTS